jgi:glycosyltransferase involved in cell wall biosynthesis
MSKPPVPLSRPLYVLVSTPSNLVGQGGIDRMMAALRRALLRRGGDDVDVRFLVSRGSGSVALSPLHVAGFCVRMAAARLAGRVDVVHINLSSHGSTYRKLVIAAVARALGIAYVLHLHGSQYQTFWKDDGGFLARRIAAMFEKAARVVVLGRAWRDFVEARAPGAAGRIVIVPNATESPVLEHVGGGESVHILFLGRIGERKGVPQLIEALGQIGDLGGWRATVAGDGEVEAARAAVAAAGLAGRVSLPGWVGTEEVAALIASADILALPSFAENLPVSVIEGMASGLAIVTTPVGAVEDIVLDGETGLLVAPGDVDGLAQALRRLVGDAALRARLGAAARQLHGERLELGAFAEALCKVWRAAAES